MDFKLTDEQIMFRDMTKDFADREIVPTIRDRDREEKFFPDLMRKMGNQGLLGIHAPVEYGGLDLDWLTLGIVSEQIGYYDFSVGINFLIATTLQVMPIMMAGDEDQKRKYIEPVTRGEMIGCFGAVEPEAGSDATAITTSAVLNGDEWVLNGNKTWITNANVCDFAIVLAQTDKSKGHRGITAFIVDKETPGFSTTKIAHKLGIRSTDTGQLFFRDCRIPKNNQLGEVGKGMKIALSCIEHTRYGISCLAVGVTQTCSHDGPCFFDLLYHPAVEFRPLDDESMLGARSIMTASIICLLYHLRRRRCHIRY